MLSGGNLEFANDNQLERNAILAGYSIEDINNLSINNVSRVSITCLSYINNSCTVYKSNVVTYMW